MMRTDDMQGQRRKNRRRHIGWLLSAGLLLATAGPARAQATQTKPSMEIYGFAMLDIGQNFKTIHPDWFDTMRVTQLPTFEGQFGEDNSTFAGVRQTRFGVKTASPTSIGDLKTIFEFEMFGVGVDAGQTTIRLRHAWGELGAFGAGQTWSVFMDPDVFPNSLEYWGPTGMVFFRNVQVRWTPVHGDVHSFMVAAERPGASGDAGIYADRVELQGVNGRNVAPDITAAYKMTQKWGYVRAAGALRFLTWDDSNNDAFDLSGDATGWGLNLSSNINFGKNDVLRLQYVFGEGIQNYMNDSPVDVGLASGTSAVSPVVGETLPITGVVAFLDHKWSEKFASTFGYSRQDIDNSNLQGPTAFKAGQYALGNLLFYPAPNVMAGGEFQWGRRESFQDDFKSDGYKIQFSFKYNFSYKLGG